MKKIYLAIPYTGIEEKSFLIANKIAAQLMLKGHCVMSPISHSHIIAKQNKLPGDWHFWSSQDREFIKWCDEIIIVKLDGWEKSLGVQREIEIAKEYGKKISYTKAKDYHV